MTKLTWNSESLKIILSSRNPSKVDQIRAVFVGLPIEILSLSEANIEEDAVEDGKTLEENALKKARFAWEHSGSWSMADDTGIFIDALDGRPGIHSARWAGDSLSTEGIMNYTLGLLKDVAPGDRTAYFETVAALIAPDGTSHIFEGIAKGSILPAPRVPCQPKMPYSPIFVPEGYDKSWAEMTIEEENKISHRGKTFRQVRQFLEKVLRSNRTSVA